MGSFYQLFIDPNAAESEFLHRTHRQRGDLCAERCRRNSTTFFFQKLWQSKVTAKQEDN